MAIPAETVRAYQYIGGQEKAVRALCAFVEQEKRNVFAGRKPLILLAGPAGIGKSALLRATASALDAALRIQTTRDLMHKDANPQMIIERGYEIVKQCAAAEGEKHAVYALEGIDVMMRLGEHPLVNTEYFIHTMDVWSEDHNGKVLVMATAVEPEALLPPVLSRFTIVNLDYPDEDGVADILDKNKQRLSLLVDKPNLFEEIRDFNGLPARIVELGWTTRQIVSFLRKAIAVRELEEPYQPIDVPFLVSQMPPAPKKLGFH